MGRLRLRRNGIGSYKHKGQNPYHLSPSVGNISRFLKTQLRRQLLQVASLDGPRLDQMPLFCARISPWTCLWAFNPLICMSRLQCSLYASSQIQQKSWERRGRWCCWTRRTQFLFPNLPDTSLLLPWRDTSEVTEEAWNVVQLKSLHVEIWA